MAEKVPINPKVSPELRTDFLAYCKTHDRTQSEVVEAALTLWLHPVEEDTAVQAIQADVRELKQAFSQLLTMLEKMVEKPKPSAPPVDTYWNHYGSVSHGQAAKPEALSDETLPESQEPARRWGWPFRKARREA